MGIMDSYHALTNYEKNPPTKYYGGRQKNNMIVYEVWEKGKLVFEGPSKECADFCGCEKNTIPNSITRGYSLFGRFDIRVKV